MDVVARTKRYVTDDRYRLRLFDTVADSVRGVAEALGGEQLSVVSGWSQERFRQLIATFDETLGTLCRVQALIGRWGGATSNGALTLGIRRIGEQLERENGNGHWRELQWYPTLRLFYAGGVAAMAAERYDALLEMMHTTVRTQYEDKPFVVAATEGFGRRAEAFKRLEGRGSDKLPFSEWMYASLQAPVGDLLFLGSDYDSAFDRFELLYAIEYAHLSDRAWAPVGRFGWKGSRSDNTPIHLLIEEAKKAGERWPPLSAGLCDGSVERFNTLTQEFLPRVLEIRRR
jgi:hypothetical protein